LTRQQQKEPEVQNGEQVKVKQKRRKPGPRLAEGETIGMLLETSESGQIIAQSGENAQELGTNTRNPFGAGRPATYNKETWKAIFERIGEGASLTTAIKRPGISHAHAYRMLEQFPELAAAYDKAKMERADRLAEEIVELADADIPSHLQGVEISAWVNQKRLQVDARKWVASKLKPKMYGDRIDVSVRDERISVLDALEAARSRVQIGMDVTDITPKLPTDQR
jgi:hypothetical protein